MKKPMNGIKIASIKIISLMLGRLMDSTYLLRKTEAGKKLSKIGYSWVEPISIFIRIPNRNAMAINLMVATFPMPALPNLIKETNPTTEIKSTYNMSFELLPQLKKYSLSK